MSVPVKPPENAALDVASDAEAFLARHRPRQLGAVPMFAAVTSELVKHVGVEQIRSLFYLAGARIAEQNLLQGIDRLGEVERAARDLLARHDWGWLRVEQHDDWVDFVHGDAPLEAWFGEDCAAWAPALFEGLYCAWLRQLGAEDRLQLRQVASTDGRHRELRFRLMHESHF